MTRCHGNHRQNTLCSFSSSFTRFCSVRPSHNCFSLVKEKVGSVKPLFPLVGPNRHLFRLGPRTIPLTFESTASSQALPALKVALDDELECSGKLSRAVVVNSNMLRGKYPAREGPFQHCRVYPKSPPPPPPNTINTANEGRFRLNVDSPYGERAQSTVLGVTHAPPRRPARPRWDFIFNLSMRESKARPVVVCLHHAGGRRHFRLDVSSSVGHCCQHFGEGWGPNRIKGGLRRGKCQRDKQALQIFLGRLQLDDADVVVYKGSKTSTSLLPSCGKSLFWMCTKRRTCHLDKHGRRCM